MNTIECAFTGRVGRDPELKHVKGGGLALLSFTVAVGDDGGDDGAPPEWVKVALFGERAEALAGPLQKGARPLNSAHRRSPSPSSSRAAGLPLSS